MKVFVFIVFGVLSFITVATHMTNSFKIISQTPPNIFYRHVMTTALMSSLDDL